MAAMSGFWLFATAEQLWAQGSDLLIGPESEVCQGSHTPQDSLPCAVSEKLQLAPPNPPRDTEAILPLIFGDGGRCSSLRLTTKANEAESPPPLKGHILC